MTYSNKIVEAFIEIPTGSQNKYEYDETRGIFKLDRVLYSSMVYPAEYGFVRDALNANGSPLDILVLVTFPTFPGCVIDARVIGYLNMTDQGENDPKVIAVPAQDPRFAEVHTLEDLPSHKLSEIVHFYQHYKELEGKETMLGTWEGPEEAAQLIDECLNRFTTKI